MPGNFLLAQTQYENIQGFDLDAATYSLQTALNNYNTNAIPTNQNAIETAFAPIAEQYTKLITINDNLKEYISDSSKKLTDSSSSEERYSNRVHPEQSILSRESSHGIMPELRMRSLPYILAISVFMASLTIFLIFQIVGFSGQINLPPSISAWLSSPASPIPFYMNPMFLGGVILLLVVTLIIFIISYFKSRNTNSK
jgi:hypothetical protein